MTINIKGYQVLIDDEDYEKVNKYKWRISSKNRGIYFETGRIWKGEKRIYLHKILINCPHELLSDHIDGNTLNCQKNNLRIATLSQNSMNRKNKNKLKYKGISFDKRNRKWEAQICISRKKLYLGRYKTPEEAYKVYCKAAKKYFGEFARFE